MSAMNAWVTNDIIAIATDTYCHKKEYGIEIPLNFVSKIYQIPQYKSCFTNQGLRDLGTRYFDFIQKEAKAKDLSSLIEYSKIYFNVNEFYPELPSNKLGTIFIYGLNVSKNKLEVYKITFNESREIVIDHLCPIIEDYVIIYKPQLNTEKSTLNLDWTSLPNAINSLIKVMILQKKEDDLLENKKVGIGGEIQLAILNSKNDPFTIQTSIIHKFDDYEKMYNLMFI